MPYCILQNKYKSGRINWVPTPTPTQRLLSSLRGRDGTGPLGGRASKGRTRSLDRGAVGDVTQAAEAEAEVGTTHTGKSEKGHSPYERKTPFLNRRPVPQNNLYSSYELLWVLTINKNLRNSLARRKGNEIIIWSWKNPLLKAELLPDIVDILECTNRTEYGMRTFL